MSALRFDKLDIGSIIEVELERGGSREPTFEHVVFLGVTGEGDDRVAEFVSAHKDGSMYRWGAYRYRTGRSHRWAYGSSAQRISINRVVNAFGAYQSKEAGTGDVETIVTEDIGTPGKWVARYFDREIGRYFDIGDPQDTKQAARVIERAYRADH